MGQGENKEDIPDAAEHMDESNKNANAVSLLGHDPFHYEEVTQK